MRADDGSSVSAAEALYGQLHGAGIDVIYDDRDERGGVKLGSMDMIGLPWQVIVGPRSHAPGTEEGSQLRLRRGFIRCFRDETKQR